MNQNTKKNNELDHLYGDNVHIIDQYYLSTLLAHFSGPKEQMPRLNHLMKEMYLGLLSHAIQLSFPISNQTLETRMASISPKGHVKGNFLNLEQRLSIVDLARAGTFPSHVIFEHLSYLFSFENLRQDHVYINRKVNEREEVIGVDFSGSKIGGDIDKSIVLLPDPMGATGESMSYVLNHLKNKIEGIAKKYIALHLIVTPEYIKKMSIDHPDLEIIALRLDRGNSSDKVLDSIPGTYPNEEYGLNEKQYIVPGAGGVGEIMNNSLI